MFLTQENGSRLFIIPQYILYFKENKSGSDNTMYSMHSKAKTVISYSQDEVFYVMETFDQIAKMMMGIKGDDNDE